MNKTVIIETESGKIQVYKEDGIEIFKGIPYAEPPVEDLRFSPPVAKKQWDDVLDAAEYGNSTTLIDHEFKVVEKFLDKERAVWDNIIN